MGEFLVPESFSQRSRQFCCSVDFPMLGMSCSGFIASFFFVVCPCVGYRSFEMANEKRNATMDGLLDVANMAVSAGNVRLQVLSGL